MRHYCLKDLLTITNKTAPKVGIKLLDLREILQF